MFKATPSTGTEYSMIEMDKKNRQTSNTIKATNEIVCIEYLHNADVKKKKILF